MKIVEPRSGRNPPKPPADTPLRVTFTGDEVSDVLTCDLCGAAVPLDGAAVKRHARRAHGTDVVSVFFGPVFEC